MDKFDKVLDKINKRIIEEKATEITLSEEDILVIVSKIAELMIKNHVYKQIIEGEDSFDIDAFHDFWN